MVLELVVFARDSRCASMPQCVNVMLNVLLNEANSVAAQLGSRLSFAAAATAFLRRAVDIDHMLRQASIRPPQLQAVCVARQAPARDQSRL